MRGANLKVRQGKVALLFGGGANSIIYDTPLCTSTCELKFQKLSGSQSGSTKTWNPEMEMEYGIKYQ